MKAIWIWLLCVAGSGLVLTTKLDLTYDLAWFLPSPSNDAQRVLVEQLGQSPGSNLMLIGIKDADDDLTLDVKNRLEELPSLASVRSDLDEISLAGIPEPLFQYRFLLKDLNYSEKELTETLKQRVLDLRYAGGSELLELMSSDPYLISLETLESISVISEDTNIWVSDDGYRVLVAETHSAAFDIGAQKEAVKGIRSTLNELTGKIGYDLSGVGVIGVDLQETIQREATIRSILASIGMAIVLLLAYRRFSTLVLAALPLLTGGIIGLTTLSLVYPQVHGITLAFGFTLLGIAIDYPLHLYSHARDKSILQAVSEVRSPLLTGLGSTAIAYLAIMFSGANGLAQLGLFTSAGLVSAALVCLFVLPQIGPKSADTTAEQSKLKTSIHWKVSIVLVAIIAGQLFYFTVSDRNSGNIWNESLTALSPVPEETLMRDNRFRAALGTADLRYQIAIRGKSLQDVLEKTESLDVELTKAKGNGLLADWRLVTSLIPSQKTQNARKGLLPSNENLQRNTSAATGNTGFRAGAFSEFQDQVELSKLLAPIDIHTYENTSLQSLIDGSLYQSGDEWVSVISLIDIGNLENLANWLESSESKAQLVDLKLASEGLVSDYRSSMATVLGAALALVFALLIWRIKLYRAIWCLSNVLLGMLCTALALLNFGTELNLYHMIALLLVAGLGLDYSLFLSNEEITGSSRKHVVHATSACVISTVTVFAILGSSAIPALHSLGITVAVGSSICFLLARFGSHSRQLN